MRALRTVTLRWPLLSSVLLSALALGLLWSSTRLASRLMPGSPFLETVSRLPVLLLVLGLLCAGRWWRGAGFRRPRGGELRHGWPLAFLVLYLLALAAWRGPHAWLPLGAEQATVALWEEFLFRGVILLLLARRSATLALFGSAALFAATHGINAVETGSLGRATWELSWPFVLGLALAILRMRTGSIWPSVAAHFLVNLIDSVSPEPLTWSGAMPVGVPAELLLFVVLFASCGLRTIPRCRRAAHYTAIGAAAGIVVLSATGLFFLGGPRPGWPGPGLDASLSVRAEQDGGTWSYAYRLRFRDGQAEIVSFSLRVRGNPEVQELRAVAGERSWDGTREGSWLVWKGGIAPETTYGFRCGFPPHGDAPFRIVYRDRYGWTREWRGRLDNSPLR